MQTCCKGEKSEKQELFGKYRVYTLKKDVKTVENFLKIVSVVRYSSYHTNLQINLYIM